MYLEFVPLVVLPVVELFPVALAEKKSPQSSLPEVVVDGGGTVGGFTGRLLDTGGGRRPPAADKPIEMSIIQGASLSILQSY